MALPGVLRGSNDRGQWPGSPRGRFVGGDSPLLMRRPRRSTSPAHRHSCSSLYSMFALGRKMAGEKQNRKGVFAQAHTTAPFISPHMRGAASFLSLPSLLPSNSLGCIGAVLVRCRYKPLMLLNDPEVECSSRMLVGPAGLTPASTGGDEYQRSAGRLYSTLISWMPIRNCETVQKLKWH